MNQDIESKFSSVSTEVRRLAGLYFEVAKYTAAEKLTVLISVLAIGLMILALGYGVLMFCSLCMVDALGKIMPMWAACLLLAALFAVFAAVVYMLRDKLIVNPVARFVSRLMLNPPKPRKNE